MSIGLDTMQAAWQKLGLNTSGLASLQTPSATSLAASQASTKSSMPTPNQIQFPDWLNPNADSQIGELTGAYANIPAAFDSSGQVAARNAAIGYNTSAGTQAANNAATEFSNRAAQSGASQLGAGVVKAQAMMPVLAQNAALKTDAADVAAKAHQEGASLAAQIAGTIGNLRTSYLQAMIGFTQGQQGLALDKFKAEQAVAGQQGQLQLGYAQLQADQFKQQQAQQTQSSEQARLAAMGLLGQARPLGNYTTNNQGQVIDGSAYYNQLQGWGQNQQRASQALLGMLS